VDVPGMCGQDSSGERLPDAVDHVLPKVPNVGHCVSRHGDGRGREMDRSFSLFRMQTHYRDAGLR